MDFRASGYEIISNLIDFVWGLLAIVGPLLIMRRIITFLAWIYRKSRGETFEGLKQDYEDATDDARASFHAVHSGMRSGNWRGMRSTRHEYYGAQRRDRVRREARERR
jgi:hypothetical protein